MHHRAPLFAALPIGVFAVIASLASRNTFAIAGSVILVAVLVWRYLHNQRQVERVRAESDAAEVERDNTPAYHPGPRV